MQQPPVFTDIHCHLIPGIDDGATDLDTTLAMARMAVEDGITTIITTPHQLGAYAHNTGSVVRRAAEEVQQLLVDHQIQLCVLPGGDVRVDESLVTGLKRGDVMSLGDHHKHVLLELPHEIYFPLEGVLQSLQQLGMVGILSHPERNRGILSRPDIAARLVDQGCLMQVTAGSVNGSFGPASQQMAETMLDQGLVHFLATDAHGVTNRRPKMRRAFERVVTLTSEEIARKICCDFPARVAAGQSVPGGRLIATKGRRTWFGRKASA